MRQSAVRRAFQGVIGMTLITFFPDFGIHNAIPTEIEAFNGADRGTPIAIHGIPVITLFIELAVPITTERDAIG
jgi:hypothetical protein